MLKRTDRLGEWPYNISTISTINSTGTERKKTAQ